MRVLSYLVLLLMFSVASAQTPTILQGDYISNVFGNSNFILNPNAQTSNCTTSGTITCANVTVTNASITRVTTTPLVARTEFNVAIGTANGTAIWATRAFDAGMKGQNCEARFTYRGFAATSKVHIKQGANTVASLNLTPATDPRIASINFPCGDLSTATTFVVTDTAILAGTNEISGIYTGLATNMANVAQAQAIFRANDTNGASIPNSTPTTVIFPSTIFDADGGYNSTTGVYTIRRAGRYQIHARVAFALVNPFPAGIDNYIILQKGGSTLAAGFWSTPSYAAYPNPQITSIVDLNVGDQINVQIQQNTGTAKSLLGSNATWSDFTLSRFPTSSELVVTPERQNTFAAASWTGDFSATRTSTAEATVSAAAFATNRTAYGKAQFTGTANDVAITVENMPPGTYKIELAAEMLQAVVNASGGVDGICLFFLKDGTNTASAKAFQGVTQFTKDAVTSATQIVQYTTTATRTFTASYKSDTTNSTICSVFKPKIIITPLDQPSNSALYVQGPVLAAATGAAIPEGYVNEFATRRITDTANRNVSVALGAWYYPWSGTLTLPAGNWNICYRVAAQMFQNRSAVNVTQWYTRIHNQTDDTTIMANLNWPTYDNNTTHVEGSLNTHSGCQPISITSSKVFRVGLLAQPLLGVPTGVILALRGDLILSELYAIRLN